MSENEKKPTVPGQNEEIQDIHDEGRIDAVLKLYEQVSDLRGKPYYRIAADMAYLESHIELEEPMYDLELYNLASKLDEAAGSWFSAGLIHEEYLDAIRYALEYGITENHSPDLTPMSPEDTRIFLMNADNAAFGSLVEKLALDNQEFYSGYIPGTEQILDENAIIANKAISEIKHNSILINLLNRAFENKENKDHYASGPYSIGFEDRPITVLFEVYYNNIPVLKGSTGELQIELCASEDIYSYDDLVSAVFAALPDFRFIGELAEKYAGDPETNMKFARYFCGDFDGVITQDAYNKLEESGELYDGDTVEYEPIFDGILYPTMADSSAAQIAKYGYHYLDDRRQKPSLDAQIQGAETRAAVSDSAASLKRSSKENDMEVGS